MCLTIPNVKLKHPTHRAHLLHATGNNCLQQHCCYKTNTYKHIHVYEWNSQNDKLL